MQCSKEIIDFTRQERGETNINNMNIIYLVYNTIKISFSCLQFNIAWKINVKILNFYLTKVVSGENCMYWRDFCIIVRC